jgi:hypothetical protein
MVGKRPYDSTSAPCRTLPTLNRRSRVRLNTARSALVLRRIRFGRIMFARQYAWERKMPFTWDGGSWRPESSTSLA